ncbi:MAG TPA: hypothetical protein ENK57_01175 [Polyangiaceae bacterium]|nr:hypothetical protein [Polyangiaceae bacterium]
MRLLHLWSGGLLLASLAGGCSGGSPLTIELRSDLVPEIEVARFEVELYEAPPPSETPVPFERVLAPALASHDYLVGQRVAEFTGQPDGRRWVEIAAIDPEGRVLVRQRADIRVEGLTSRVVIIDRECVGVTCPSPGGSPSALACLAGQCVDPRCSPGDTEFCPDDITCDRNTDCDAPSATCATARCADSFCFDVVEGGSCPEGTWCNPETACEPLPGTASPDAGVPSDAGCVPIPCSLDNPCHAGVLECGSDMCVRAGNVVSGAPCDGGECDGMGTCVPST